MGWGTAIEEIRPYVPDGGHVEVVEGVGHFIHIEQPVRRRPAASWSSWELRHDRHGSPRPLPRRVGAPHPARRIGPAGCCCSTAWVRRHRARCRPSQPTGQAPFTRSTSPGTGRAPSRSVGGYTAEILLADADLAAAAPGQGHHRGSRVSGRTSPSSSAGRVPTRSWARCWPTVRASRVAPNVPTSAAGGEPRRRSPARPIRTPSSSSAAISVPPTMRPRSFGWRTRGRRSTSRSA